MLFEGAFWLLVLEILRLLWVSNEITYTPLRVMFQHNPPKPLFSLTSNCFQKTRRKKRTSFFFNFLGAYFSCGGIFKFFFLFLLGSFLSLITEIIFLNELFPQPMLTMCFLLNPDTLPSSPTAHPGNTQPEVGSQIKYTLHRCPQWRRRASYWERWELEWMETMEQAK